MVFMLKLLCRCGCGGTGRRDGLRIHWVTVQVRFLSSAPIEKGCFGHPFSIGAVSRIATKFACKFWSHFACKILPRGSRLRETANSCHPKFWASLFYWCSSQNHNKFCLQILFAFPLGNLAPFGCKFLSSAFYDLFYWCGKNLFTNFVRIYVIFGLFLLFYNNKFGLKFL